MVAGLFFLVAGVVVALAPPPDRPSPLDVVPIGVRAAVLVVGGLLLVAHALWSLRVRRGSRHDQDS